MFFGLAVYMSLGVLLDTATLMGCFADNNDGYRLLQQQQQDHHQQDQQQDQQQQGQQQDRNLAGSTIYDTANGAIEVEITFQWIDGDPNITMSNAKCVKFLKGAPDYTSACFNTFYNENDVLVGCSVTFDEQSCQSCSICTANLTKGYDLDCNNIQPDESTMNQCEVITNQTIQEVLVDTTFGNTVFDWEYAMNITDGGNNSTTGGSGAVGLPGTLFAAIVATMYMTTAMLL